MGMTYWIETLEGRKISKESDDHSIMHELSEELDAECESLGIPKLSSFVDYTDLEYNVSEDEEDVEIDEETGYGYGIDDMEWFDIASGLSCLEKLRQHVAAGWKKELDTETRTFLLDEFDDCIGELKKVSSENGKFHLAVIM